MLCFRFVSRPDPRRLTILVSDAITANDMDNTRGVSQNYEEFSEYIFKIDKTMKLAIQ